MPHIHELYDFTISVFIVHDDKVLLVNHPRYDKWLPIGGHIELDEDPDQALYREIAEETGLAVEILSDKPEVVSPETKYLLTPNYVDVHEANLPHRHISFIYFGRSKNADSKLSDEHTDMKWFTPQEFKDKKYNLSKALLFYCDEALKQAIL